MGKKELEWTAKEKKELLKTVVLTVNEIDSEGPGGRKGKYIVMDAPDWVIVVPVLGENFLMVRQWRHGNNSLSIEFPGGVINKGESPEEAAIRETEEETGYKAGKLTYLGSANPNPALMSNRVHFFAAEDLQGSGIQHLDEDECVEYMQIPQKEVYEKIGSQEYPHALMMSALLKFKLMKEKKVK
ncbi:NUDIX hydrolase [Treponema sp.]|uniref:NUDIX hydrolase n=1 Tax=Treponema sp. TaxID=166 RepID=UPI0025E9CC7A|nr:NUDIX hydrolase [Treponema sp.]MBR4323187.1 NUDIX hydrolase [Treponema sp.]